jgi:hypothetical protein
MINETENMEGMENFERLVEDVSDVENFREHRRNIREYLQDCLVNVVKKQQNYIDSRPDATVTDYSKLSGYNWNTQFNGIDSDWFYARVPTYNNDGMQMYYDVNITYLDSFTKNDIALVKSEWDSRMRSSGRIKNSDSFTNFIIGKQKSYFSFPEVLKRYNTVCLSTNKYTPSRIGEQILKRMSTFIEKRNEKLYEKNRKKSYFSVVLNRTVKKCLFDSWKDNYKRMGDLALILLKKSVHYMVDILRVDFYRRKRQREATRINTTTKITNLITNLQNDLEFKKELVGNTLETIKNINKRTFENIS